MNQTQQGATPDGTDDKTGAVGSAVGQIAKIKGCRTIGIAGGAAKCKRLTDDYRFDVSIDYRGKSQDALTAEIAAAVRERRAQHQQCERGTETRSKGARRTLRSIMHKTHQPSPYSSSSRPMEAATGSATFCCT